MTNMSHIIRNYTNESDIWRDAWKIADPGAANPVAVARSLYAASAFLMHELRDTESVKKHPALKVMAGQLSALYNTSALGAEDDDYTKVKAVVASLDADIDLDVAITAANADLDWQVRSPALPPEERS